MRRVLVGPGRLKVDKPVVTAGGDFVVSGKPGAVVVVDSLSDGTPKFVTLDDDGHATISTTPPGRTLSIHISGEPGTAVEVVIIDPS